MVVVGLLVIVVAVAVMMLTARGRIAKRTPAGARTVAPHASPSGADSSNEDGDGEPVRHSLRPWVLRGIEVEEAKRWIDRGFDADHAYLLRSLDVDPRTASRLRKAGLEDSALVALIEEASFRHHTSIDELVALAERDPELAPLAVAWMELGIDADRALSYAAAGFTTAASDAWRGAGWDMDAALPWFAAKFEPASARAWRSGGFDANEAQAWRREHFGVKQAVEWRRLGDTPERAREVEHRLRDARVTVTDGLQWLDRGFTVDDICDGRPQSEVLRRVTTPRVAATLRGVPVTRDDLLSAAGQLARASGAPEVRLRLEHEAAGSDASTAIEVSPELIEQVLAELQRLDDRGALGAPHAARALGRRLARGLAVCTGTAARIERTPAGHR